MTTSFPTRRSSDLSYPFRFARKARRRKGRLFRPVPPDESGQDRSLGLPEQQGRRLKRSGIARKKGLAPPCPSALRRSTRSTAASGSISGRSDVHTFDLYTLMRLSYPLFSLF